ncbi:MAG TPA: hypothetical protein VF829_02345 [Candidatus Paceibacterota bacterium]
MKIWKQKVSFLVTAGFVYLLGEYLRGQWFLNTKLDRLCHPYWENGSLYCHSPYQGLGFVFIAAGEVLAIAGVILLLANEKGVRAWWRMSRWFLPVAALITIFLPVSSPLGIFLGRSPNYTATIWLLGFIYILTTLVLVIRDRVS